MNEKKQPSNRQLKVAQQIRFLVSNFFIKEDFSLPKVKVGLCITPWGEFQSPDRKNYRVWERFEIFTQMYDDPYPQGGIQFIDGKYIQHYNEWLVNSFKADKKILSPSSGIANLSDEIDILL